MKHVYCLQIKIVIHELFNVLLDIFNDLNAVKIMIILNDDYFDFQEVVNYFLHQEIKLEKKRLAE